MTFDFSERSARDGLIAFVDEFGNPDLDTTKAGATTLFIIVAVLVNSEDYEAASVVIDDVCLSHLGGGELKSSKLSKNHERRHTLLDKCCKAPFSYCALVVNKARVHQDSGLQYRRSFYKYFHSLLYEQIRRSGRDLFVVADQIGGRDFIQSFEAYMDRAGMPDLLSNFQCRMVNSKNERLIQLADLIAGTLAQVFDPDRQGEHSLAFREKLRSREIAMIGWPYFSSDTFPATGEPTDEADRAIRRMTVQRVNDFLARHDNSDLEDKRMQVATLRYLFFKVGFDRDDQPTYADELLAILEKQGYTGLNKQGFSSRIIGPLRDDGIIISAGQQGYKLALSLDDVRTYVQFSRSIVEPMLSRLQTARTSVKFATHGEVDILAATGNPMLKKLVDTYSDAHLPGGDFG